jgi:hypothetical protein
VDGPYFILKRILTGVVITAAVAGIIVFGYRLLGKSFRGSLNKENPWEFELDTLQKIDPELILYEEIGRIELTVQNPRGIASGPKSNIYVTGDNALEIIRDDRNDSVRIFLEDTAKSVTVDYNNGDIYLGMQDHVEVFDSSGSRKDIWPELGELALITSIALTRDFVFVADAGNHIILRFNRSGRLLGRIGDKNETRGIAGFILPSPYFDIAAGTGDSIWAANNGRHLIENYSYEGELLSSWGQPSMNIEGFSGCCNPMHFALLPDGSFVTSEKGLLRVKVYDSSGGFVSVVAGAESFSGRTIAPDLAVDSNGQILALDNAAGFVRIFSRKKSINAHE